jgi:hypothetical protein
MRKQSIIVVGLVLLAVQAYSQLAKCPSGNIEAISGTFIAN